MKMTMTCGKAIRGIASDWKLEPEFDIMPFHRKCFSQMSIDATPHLGQSKPIFSFRLPLRRRRTPQKQLFFYFQLIRCHAVVSLSASVALWITTESILMTNNKVTMTEQNKTAVGQRDLPPTRFLTSFQFQFLAFLFSFFVFVQCFFIVFFLSIHFWITNDEYKKTQASQEEEKEANNVRK